MHSSMHRHTTTIRVATSDEYFSSRGDILRSPTPGPSRVWRSPEPTIQIQQPVPIRAVWPPNRGPAFPKLERGNPHLNEENSATIEAWFKQNIPALLQEWPQPVCNNDWADEDRLDPATTRVNQLPPYWIRMGKELPCSRLRHPELRGSLPFTPTDEPNTIPFPTE